MSNLKFKVDPLFAEPIFRGNIEYAIDDGQVEFIKKQKMRNNKINLISDNLYLLNEPELKSVKQAVEEALEIYASQVMGITQELYLTQSWSLINQTGMGMHGHSHSNSIVSGSLYFSEMPEPVSSMIFDRNTAYQQFQFKPEDNRQTIFNAPLHKITPNRYDIILFSSRLQHFVESNASPEPRYSIAFNSFIRGKLGDFRDVSELEIK